jgi:FAD synthase
MLGHWHRIDGPVIHGEKRGRELGYPDRQHVGGRAAPAAAWRLCREGGCADRAAPGQLSRRGVLGVRPMFGENLPNLETFIFDFKGDLYGAAPVGRVRRIPAARAEIRRPARADRADGCRLRPRRGQSVLV